MPDIAANAPGTSQLLMGNEAIARGALEAGVGVAAAYPGNPSSEIIATLSQVAKQLNLYVEWSINEKVALEVAAAASFAGVRAISAMKQNGLNVALDFLANLNLTGVPSGLVLVVCDDPEASPAPMNRTQDMWQKPWTCLFSSPQRFKRPRIWPNGHLYCLKRSQTSVS